PLRTQQRLGEEPRGGRLADAARAGEQIGMRDAPGRQRIAQRAGDRILADDRVERLRPPLSREDLIAHTEPPTASQPLTGRPAPRASRTGHPCLKPISRSYTKVTVHPPSNDSDRDIPLKPAP